MKKFFAYVVAASVLLTACYPINVEPKWRKGRTQFGSGGGISRGQYCDEIMPQREQPSYCEEVRDQKLTYGECCHWRNNFYSTRTSDVCFETWCLWDDSCGWEYLEDWCL